jgi:glycogen operon protein
MDEYNERGERIKDDMLLLILNAHWEDIPFTLPGKDDEPDWDLLVQTANPISNSSGDTQPTSYKCGAVYNLEARSLTLFRQFKGKEG